MLEHNSLISVLQEIFDGEFPNSVGEQLLSNSLPSITVKVSFYIKTDDFSQSSKGKIRQRKQFLQFVENRLG